MRQLLFTSNAYNSIYDIGIYIADTTGDPDKGDRIIEKIIEQCAKLARLDGTLGRSRAELGDNIRSFAFGSYMIYFRYHAKQLEIIAVLHGHRDADTYFNETPQ